MGDQVLLVSFYMRASPRTVNKHVHALLYIVVPLEGTCALYMTRETEQVKKSFRTGSVVSAGTCVVLLDYTVLMLFCVYYCNITCTV